MTAAAAEDAELKEVSGPVENAPEKEEGDEEEELECGEGCFM